MSTPFLTFRCDKCSYRESSFVTSGRFVWSHNGEMFSFYPRLGICDDCTDIVAVEGIPDQSVFERARALHPDIKGNISVILEKDEAKSLAYQENFQILERIMDQRRKPVCLKCGGENCRKIILPRVDEGRKLTDIKCTPLGIKHPVCDGNLLVEGSGKMRISISPETNYFDLSGKHRVTLHGREGHINN